MIARVVASSSSIALFIAACWRLSSAVVKCVEAEQDSLSFVPGDDFPDDDWAAS